VRILRTVTGTAAPLDRPDVDTDQIIPSDWLKRVERTGFGVGLFSEWRDDRSFVLNDERYAGARILLAGPNFGIGSSREHAVWALLDYGFEAVVSTSFGEIFQSNSAKSGLLAVQVDRETSRALFDAVLADPTVEVTIDVERRSISAPLAGIEAGFPMDDFTRERFLQGLDDIGLTLRHSSEIDAYEAARPAWMPVGLPGARPA
jgi:3-isopropylmalate/(R)-2-methylmalate dehydratase small subunit